MHGIRAMAVLGPVLEAQGLPELRTGAVRVWCDPTQLDDLTQVLRGAGWAVAAPETSPTEPRRLTHPGLPAEIHLHQAWAGFVTEPEAVFTALWGVSTVATIAGVPVTCCSVAGNVALLALELAGPDLDQLGKRAAAVMTPEDRQELVAIAEFTGAGEALQPVLDQLARA